MKNDLEKRKMMRERRKEYLKNHKLYSVYFANDDAQKIEENAEQEGIKPSAFIRKVTLSNLHGTGYVVPSNIKLSDLITQLKKTGSNINQAIRYVHYSRNITYEDLRALQGHLLYQQQEITKALRMPPSIEEILITHLKQHPESREKIIQFLKDYDH